MANKIDPRVDSDRIGASGNAPSAGGYGQSGSGLTGGSHTGTHSTGTYGQSGSGLTGGSHTGTHSTGGYGSTGVGNTHSTGTGHHLPGPADNTAGPHSSNMANKLDPRVDSDLDGSKTTGGDRTYG